MSTKKQENTTDWRDDAIRDIRSILDEIGGVDYAITIGKMVDGQCVRSNFMHVSGDAISHHATIKGLVDLLHRIVEGE